MVVEGLGDRKAFPTLVTKTAQLFGQDVFVCHIVEGGGWEVLKAPGELERNVALAAADKNPDEVLVVVDLEDDCAKNQYEENVVRLSELCTRFKIPVKLCFCVREFETWFLEGYEGIVQNSSEQDIKEKFVNPSRLNARGAKEEFERLIGRSYRQSIDQEKYAKRLELSALFGSSRSYRKFAKIVSNLPYETLEQRVTT